MGQGVTVKRRDVVGGGLGAAALAAAGAGAGLGVGCTSKQTPALQAAWVGASHARGHRLRSSDALPAPAVQRKTAVLIVGAGIAGLSAARAFTQAGMDDVQLLELEDSAGGNSRGHQVAGMACPLGAHYLPLPGPQSHEVSDWLHEIGLLKNEMGRTVADERHLCHSPQERLFIDGAWAEGLLPPDEMGSDMAAQIRRFSAAVQSLQTELAGARGAASVSGSASRFGLASASASGSASGSASTPAFAMPAHRAAWGATQATLNTQTFSQWLDAQGITHERLRWYLDYCCRDDYGAGTGVVSAWAGVHYFASRHGFHAPGQEQAEREAVFTWPEGNAWLAQRLAAPLHQRLHTGRTVLRVSENKHTVQVLAWDEQRQQLEAWTAPQVVLAVPLFIAARVLQSPPPALREATALLRYAPWLVANLHLTAPLLARTGAPPSWDNVTYGSGGLGYVDAQHQSLRQGLQTAADGASAPTVLTAYHAVPSTERKALLSDEAGVWAEVVFKQMEVAHPDIRQRVQHMDLMRWGHAMAIPAPGVQRHPALVALRAQRGRVRFAHADLAGYSVFEEAFTAGAEVAKGARRS
jgi:monoamine oxidase